MRAEHIVCLWTFVHYALADPSFIYPPASEQMADFSRNLVMFEGDFKVIQWQNVDNPNENRISVTVWQSNGTKSIGDREYVIRNAVPDTLSASWTVSSSKNLTLSPMFRFSLFFEGETDPLTKSHHFNISAKSTTTTSSSSISSTTSATTSATTSSTASTQPLTSSPVTTATPSPSQPPPAPRTSSLDTGAKAGIAVGVIGATFVGVLTGWLFFGRNRRMDKTQSAASALAPVRTSPYERIEAEQQYPYEVHGQALPLVSYELAPHTRHNN